MQNERSISIQQRIDQFHEALSSDREREAKKLLKALSNSEEVDPREIACMQSHLLIRQDSCEEALDLLLDSMETHGANPALALQCAEIYLSWNEGEKALEVLERAGDVPEKYTDDFAVCRVEALLQVNRFREALEKINRPLKPESNEQRLALMELRAETLGQLGRFEEALSIMQELLAEAPDRGHAWLVRGFLCLQTDRLDEAALAVAKARELDACQGLAFHVSAEAFKKVVEEAVKKMPDDLKVMAGRIPIECHEKGFHFVTQTDDGHEIENGALGGASFVGSVRDPSLPWGCRPEKVIVFQRNLESGAGSRRGLLKIVGETLTQLLTNFALAHTEISVTEAIIDLNENDDR